MYIMYFSTCQILATAVLTAIVQLSYSSSSNDHVRNWCSNAFDSDEKTCFKTLQHWCRSRLSAEERHLCEDIPNHRHSPEPDTGPGTGSGTIKVRHLRDADFSPKTEKASPEKMSSLKQLLNKAAGQFAGQFQQLVQLGQLFVPKPPANAEAVHTELAVNDPEAYFQGDVDLTNNQIDNLLGALDKVDNFLANLGNLGGFGRKRKRRKVSKPPNYELWPNPDTNPIPFQFDNSVPADTRNKILDAIKLWQQNTCVRFRQDGPGIDRIEFVDGSGCSSFVGRAGGTQEVSLHTPGCNLVGIASHEIGHALGFFHEQARPDQDKFVTINYNNILLWRYNNFVPQSWDDVNDYGERYDYGSVMHYDSKTKGFTINNNDYSILAKDTNYQQTMGQRRGPSFVDFKQVNKAYCSHKCPQKLGCKNGGYEDPNNCAACKCPDGFAGTLCDDVAPSSPGCGGKLIPSQDWQTVTSPGYPNGLSAGLNCNWLIRAPAGYKVFLEFNGGSVFDFPCKDTCVESYAEVKRGPDFDPTGYRFCCNQAPKPIESANEDLVIILFTSIAGGRGFNARYRTDATAEPPTPTQAPNGGGGGEISTDTTPAPPPITEEPTIPSTFAPVIGCQCSQWTQWTQCNDRCGGCGRMSRTRSCQGSSECQAKEEKMCNMQACPASKNGFQISPAGKFVVLNQGCCLGLFNTGGQCQGLTDAIGNQISRLFGGFNLGNLGRK